MAYESRRDQENPPGELQDAYRRDEGIVALSSMATRLRRLKNEVGNAPDEEEISDALQLVSDWLKKRVAKLQDENKRASSTRAPRPLE